MKVLTAAQMREVDRRTTELGIPGPILMENAGCRVVEFLEREFAPLETQRIAILCGKGNNGGDGLVIARQLFTRIRPRSLHVILAAPHENVRMLEACGCPVQSDIPAEARRATIVVDALLGTGLRGPATGRLLDLIREINTGFPEARIVSVDIPSGLPSDTGAIDGEAVRAYHTVTFTAPKVSLVLPPACEYAGQLHIAQIGSPSSLYDDVDLSLVEPSRFAHLFAPRPPSSHKGTFGHVLVIGGSLGKTGAPRMTGMAALRAGAGLVTVASTASSLPPELMTEPLPEDDFFPLTERMTVIAIGPGLGSKTEGAVRKLVDGLPLPVVVDADALNAIAGTNFKAPALRVLTPHPGEMARLTSVAGRVESARSLAIERRVVVVLKGHRTLIAFPDGQVCVNPTGSPALATGGTGDVLTGLIAGLLAQFPKDADAAILAAVYLHGRAGELGAAVLGEKSFIATDILQFLPEAMRECAPRVSHPLR